MVKAKHLVVDSGGFLKNADIKNLGENIYTVKEVISEIKDKVTRQRLSVLPYQINFKTPSPESIQKVTEVSKRTGDYPSLSVVDIQVLALAFELATLYDQENLLEMKLKKNEFQFGAEKNSRNESLPGFFNPAKTVTSEKNGTTDKEKPDDIEKDQMEIVECDESEEIVEEENNNSQISEDDEEGWISPANIAKFQNDGEEECEEVVVACLTTDFAMQNVLMKMSLKVFSVDGMLIKSIRSYVLRCHACFNITKIMTKEFCPKCGNNTLKKVPTTVLPDGTVKYFLSRNPKVMNKRGKKFSLPMPKGGKHSQNPILCEDQPIPQNRVSRKAMRKTDVWSDGYGIDGSSPFAMNETESRAFKLGIRRGYGNCNGRRRNPNAVGQKFVRRKK